ncbi:hypothetical protein Htur_4626 (plasmid) [Haloterrigena turkmenica DSM 5511]|uniref:Uncharacterized protein n=1 Tax=Haloterrigena turkmenica (strain ATCC 51198 / DSM 5511 / JCM 9101 / NCIMB 13204 / VKM B-1734 / 4k) TaxID=543526 RepID=D2S215_HALTV|nr:hypothetical protein Htur_4626 [Haloterrigena turkmenica DSM 5511]
MDVGNDPTLATSSHIVIAKRYERCIEDSLPDEAERIENAPTLMRQKQIAKEIAKEHFNS